LVGLFDFNGTVSLPYFSWSEDSNYLIYVKALWQSHYPTVTSI